MADQVEEVKQKTDIVSLLSEYIPLKKAGRNYKALCPFHGEKSPSFMVSSELQMYKCFGCGEAGDVFSFLEKYEAMEFAEALRFLAERAGVKLESYKGGEANEKERLYEINKEAAKFYSYVLLGHPKGKLALNYLTKERGIGLEAIRTFQLGFAPDVPDALKKYLVDKKKANPKDLERLGLGYFKAGGFVDKLGGRLIFPLFDHRGNIAGFAGRVLPGAREDTAKYVNSPETPVYHKSNLLFGLNLTKSDIKKAGEAILVEGELDMIASWQAGVKNTIAIKGSALTDEQVRLLGRFTKKAVLALDSDFAGDLAARRGIVTAQEAGLDLRVARLDGYKDPDEAAREDVEEYKKALTDAVGVWDYLVDSIFAKHKGSLGSDTAEISREIVPVLSSIPDKILQAHYIEVVANKLTVPSEAVGQEVEDYVLDEKTKKAEVTVETGVKSEQKTRRQLLEERLLALAFQSDPTILLKGELTNLIITPLTKRIVEEYKKFCEDHIKFSPSEFSEALPKELLDGFAEVALRDTGGVTERPEDLGKEFALVERELRVADVRRKLEIYGAKIREYEEKGEKDKMKTAQEKFSLLTQDLADLEHLPTASIILR